MKIKLHKAFDLLSHCAAVIIVSDSAKPVIYPATDEITGENNNEFLFLGWEVDGLEFSATFIEENNQEVEINNSYMLLEDDEGDLIELKLLFPTNLASFCQDEDII